MTVFVPSKLCRGYWLTASLALLSACATAPHQESAIPQETDAQKIERLSTEQKQLQNALTTMTSKLEGIEAKMGALNDKLEASRASIENLLANQRAQPQGVHGHSADLGGIAVGTEPASTDPEAGFVSDDAVQKYRKGMVLLESKNYPEAVLAFSGFVDQYPDHALAGSAQYHLGEAYFRQKEYKLAAREYQRVLTSYDRSPHIAETLRDLAESEEKTQQSALAAEHRQQLLSLFPHSPAALGQKVEASPSSEGSVAPSEPAAHAAPADAPVTAPMTSPTENSGHVDPVPATESPSKPNETE